MYRVKNITNGKVILGDLGNLVLKKDEEVDLDRMFSRGVIDASKDLQKAIDPNRCLLAVLHRDVPLAPAQDISQVEETVRRMLSQMGVGDHANTQQKLDLILAALAKGVQSEPAQQKEERLPDHGVSSEKSIDIQTRLIQRLSNNVEAHVEAKTETRDSDVKKNADDLGNLLGDL
jgi:hypothetical protein